MQFKGMHSIYGEEVFRIRWTGVRLMAQTPDINGAGIHLRGFLNVGQVLDYDVPLVGLGIGVTLD